MGMPNYSCIEWLDGQNRHRWHAALIQKQLPEFFGPIAEHTLNNHLILGAKFGQLEAKQNYTSMI